MSLPVEYFILYVRAEHAIYSLFYLRTILLLTAFYSPLPFPVKEYRMDGMKGTYNSNMFLCMDFDTT